MAETAFDLTYEGDAIAEGRMPIRDLAPALLALGEMFAEASELVEPTRPPASLNIEATGKGSFVVHLVVAGWDHIIDIFSSNDAVGLVTLREAIIGTGGIFALVKKAAHRRVVKTEEIAEPGQVVLKFDDETTLTVPKATWEMYGDVEARKKVSEVVRPLSKEGVERLSFEVEREVTISVEAKDAADFEPPEDALPLPEPLGSEEVTLVVSIVSVAFKDDNKWRLSDGVRTFYARIRDDAFLIRVENGHESFTSGDRLRCRMRILQTSDAEGLHTEYEVLEVLEHMPRPKRPQLRIELPTESPGWVLSEDDESERNGGDEDDEDDVPPLQLPPPSEE